MARDPQSAIEPLESRIAPATLVNPITAGIGSTGTTVDLANAFEDVANHTLVRLSTNFDSDPTTPGIQGDIIIELYDDATPLTVQNFLKYVNGKGNGDYDGVFFHRLVKGFVLQGGGFQANAPASHVEIGPTVHNEYDPGDVSRSNLRGTVAMAKTGLGPHTASSEFFINLADNSDNLDNQNGGFTVFGRVVGGMDIVDAIAGLDIANFSSTHGALNEVPVQENAVIVPGVAPTPQQLITILDAEVIPPTPGDADGATFTVVSVTEDGSPSSLVNASIKGSTLALKYATGKSGVATVTVQMSKPGEAPVTEDFVVTIRPNLIGNIVSDNLGPVIQPGENGDVKFKVTNNTASLFDGRIDVKFYLSKVTAADESGTILDATDRLVGTLDGAKVKLKGAASTTLTGKVVIPADLSTAEGEVFVVIAEFAGSAGNTVTELFTDDNIANDGSAHRFFTKPNMVANLTADTLSDIIVPGDVGNLKIELTNFGAGTLRGDFDVVFFLSHVDGTGGADPAGTLLQLGVDRQIGLLEDVPINLSSEKSRIVSANVQIPRNLVISQGEQYKVLALAVPANGATIDEAFTNDNVATNDFAHQLFNAFGTFPTAGGVRKNVPLTYIDALGQTVTMTLTNGGFGQIFVNGAELDLGTVGTNARSILSAKTGPGQGHTQLRGVFLQENQGAEEPLGTVAFGSVDLHGDFYAGGGVKNLTLGNLQGGADGAQIQIGEFGPSATQKVKIQLGNVSDYSLVSVMPVSSLSMNQWLDANGPADEILVMSLGSLSAKQNFEADFATATTAKLSSFTVGGALNGSTVKIAGNVGSVTLGAMTSSRFFAGVTDVPDSIAAFNAGAASIGSFVIKGIAGAIGVMADSQVAAASIGSIRIQSLDTDPSAEPLGFTADAIKSYVRGAVKLSNLTAGVFDKVENYSVRVV